MGISLRKQLKDNEYPGRGIVLGKTGDGKKAVAAYFIMGRSVNSRNRVFVEEGEGIRTQAFDESLLTDPSLIIYAPVRVFGEYLIVTNGDQTDTIYEGLEKGLTFEQSLRSRRFEPDGPNFTPRISGCMKIADGNCPYSLSILKSDEGREESCVRFTYSYEEPIAGEGHLIHTYLENGDPIPSFRGEPVTVDLMDDIDAFTEELWDVLDPENKVSLFVRYIDLNDGAIETRIVNKNQK